MNEAINKVVIEHLNFPFKRIYLNGKEIPGVLSINYDQDAGEAPRIRLEIRGEIETLPRRGELDADLESKPVSRVPPDAAEPAE